MAIGTDHAIAVREEALPLLDFLVLLYQGKST